MAEQKRPITAEDVYRIQHLQDPRISPDGKWIAYVHVQPDKMENGYKNNIWLVSTDGGEPIQITRSDKDTQPRWSPDGRTLAFVSARSKKPQIYLLPIGMPGGEPRPLTNALNGALEPDWSPDGTQIAYIAPMSADERAKEDSGEEDAPPVDKLEIKHREERREQDEKDRWDPRLVWRIPYRKDTSFVSERYTQIYVMPVANGLEGDAAKPRRLTGVDADYEPPKWTPDGKFLITSRTIDPEMDQPFMGHVLYRINVANGQSTQLTDDNYMAGSPLVSPDGKWIAFARAPRERIAERITRLAVIPAAGGEIRDLNLELDRELVGMCWSADSQTIFFSVNNAGDVEIYRADAVSGSVEQVISGTMEIGEFDVAADGGIAYTACTPTAPMELFWHPAGAAQSQQKTTYNAKFLEEVIVQDVHEMRYQAPDGQELQGWYILPVGYEEGQTYPLAFNIHGGPHAMWGPSTRTMWHEWQFHAARGYAVFYANPRGSGGYTEKFMSDLHANWGDLAYSDLMTGVDLFLEKGIADPERMAVTGGSYGGYMTAWIVGHTDRFKAAVSQRGVYNMVAFFGLTDIPLFINSEYGVNPWEDPDMLWKHSPLAYAHNITTPLLLIHSENDYRVPIAEAEQLFAFVRRNGGTVKLLRYPRDGHELSRSGEPKHRISRLTEMVAWFDEYCMPD